MQFININTEGGVRVEFLPLIIDLAFAALIIISIFDGRRKGFVKMVLSFVATVLSWLTASELSQPLAAWANENFVHGWISGSVENAIASSLGSGTNALIESIPDYIANAAEAAGISLQSLALQLSGTVDPAQAAEKIYAAVESTFVVPAIRIVAFFIIFAITERIIALGIGIINRFFKLPIIKSFNKLLGGTAGALKGIISVAVISLAFSFVTMIAPETDFSQAVGQSGVYQIMIEAITALFSN